MKLSSNPTYQSNHNLNFAFQDIAILNFFFDTPIITEITLEMRTNIYDMISAVGGTLGLFTGISIITFVEIVYWSFKLSAILLGKMKDNVLSYGKSMNGDQEKEKNVKSSEEVFAFQVTNGLKVPPSNI